MAHDAHFIDLLNRANEVFTLARRLGQDFEAEREGRFRASELQGWSRHQLVYGALTGAVVNLRDEIQNPPEDFALVAEQLRRTADLAKQIRDRMQTDDGRLCLAYLDFFPELNSVSYDGWKAVEATIKGKRLDDPFAFLDSPQIAHPQECGHAKQSIRDWHPWPLQNREDVARVVHALRDLLEAFEPDNPLLSRTSDSFDGLRRAFCHKGDGIPRVSVDANGLPNAYDGLPELIRTSTALHSEARDVLGELIDHARGLGIWFWMTDDRNPNREATRQNGGDYSALRRMRALLRDSIAILEPCAKASVSALPAATAPPTAVHGEGGTPPKPTDPDGPFNAGGFRFLGIEVQFRRAALQYRLVLALWDCKQNQMASPRPVDDVMSEVWGENHDTSESAFRQLCSDTRHRFQAANCPLDIKVMNGKVQLVRL